VVAQTHLRKAMWVWLNTAGKNFKDVPIAGHTYLGGFEKKSGYLTPIDTTIRKRNAALSPFPINPKFVSESVLSEALRLEAWKRVQVEKKSVRQVSVELNISMERVGAVVRLVEIEKKMRAEVCSLSIFPLLCLL
jgi:hypothetical protein